MEAVLTPYQQLAVLRDVTGHSFRLAPYDEIVKVLISDDRCGVQVKRWSPRDYATETRLYNPRLVTSTWTRDGDRWKPVIVEVDGHLTNELSIPMEVPDGRPYLIVSHRGGKSLDEYRDQLYWDALCARPGAGRLNQRDYDQVQADVARRWSRTLGRGDYYENAPYIHD